MHELLWKAGFENTGENRRLLDKAVRETLGMERSEEPEVWERVQQAMKESRKEFEGKIIRLLLTY